MNRREFLAAGIGSSLPLTVGADEKPPGRPSTGEAASPTPSQGLGDPMRQLFPRLAHGIYLNAASGTPLGQFAEAGLRRYEDFWRLGNGDGRRDYVSEMLAEIRGLFAGFIGSKAAEIGLVHCTKAGEQIVLDGLEALRRGGNVVTNDLHFSGSLHNLVGLKKSGLDVRIVRARGWDVSAEAMAEAIDEKTALVDVTLVSNVNGRFEELPKLAKIAHAHGAYVYADIIQAAGIVPIDVHSLGIDFAACSGYKWLFGPHGVGFLYVRQELQGTALPDRLFPGNARSNYPPWVAEADAEAEDFTYHAPTDARRYQPGHVSYLGYCALYEALKFLAGIGVETLRSHSVRLARRLRDQIDAERYPSISPDVDRSPILAFETRDPAKLRERLKSANVVVTVAGNRVRVSPALYNNENDVDRLAEVLNQK